MSYGAGGKSINNGIHENDRLLHQAMARTYLFLLKWVGQIGFAPGRPITEEGMTPEKILEIANRYTAPEAESRIIFGADGNATGGTVTMTYWNFCEEELIAFAQSVIEADRESSDEPVAWLYERCDNPDVYVSPDSAFSWFQEGRYTIPLYTHPVPARKPLAVDLVEALEGMLNIVNDSLGVVGYHLNGAVANWDEFKEVDIAETALEKAHGIGETK